MNQELEAIVRNQHEYFGLNKTREIDFRIRQLTALRDLIRANEERIYDALWNDLRKPRFEAYATEIGMVLAEISRHLRYLRRWSRPERVATNQLIHFWSASRIIKEPYGVVLILAPWNFPFLLVMHPLIGAISAGNCIALKPSEFAPHTTMVIKEMLHRSFPQGYISVFEGGVEFSRELLDHKWDYIFFTGSMQVARHVMAAAARNLTPLSLELGGKSPCIVEADANLKVAAARIAWGKFLNAGQMCIAPDYVFVHATVREEFLTLLRKQIERFFGADPRTSPDYGRIITEEKTERLKRLLKDVVVLLGGEVIPQDRYVAPTVVGPVATDHPLMQEEIFGPILPLLEFRSVKEALDHIRSGPKPLALYLFTSNPGSMKEVLDHTSSGGVCINDTLSHFANPLLPFGGVGDSGIGRYHGKFSFDTFSHRRAVLKKATWIDLPVRYPPYGNKLQLIKWLIK